MKQALALREKPKSPFQKHPVCFSAIMRSSTPTHILKRSKTRPRCCFWRWGYSDRRDDPVRSMLTAHTTAPLERR
ncbi:hypothetical protein HNY73_010192 [Argiope bruennichi]|uniref:Uncharacterized protein n=1 Tax=Argiope bruennichi TaxID=94029 RepID=A0A8T0F0B9_ARGBR|nr:hypothetical protein HNY73_010192 [Argiope bruennichi]